MEQVKEKIKELVERVKQYISEFDVEAFKENFTTKVKQLVEFINSKLNK